MIVAIVPKKNKIKRLSREIKISSLKKNKKKIKKKKQQRLKIKGRNALDTFVFSCLSCYLCRACLCKQREVATMKSMAKKAT